MKSYRGNSLGFPAWLIASSLGMLTGCGFQWPRPQTEAEAVSVVLTFDDGPLSADASADHRGEAREALLDPLRQILNVLAMRNLQAVFYIAGPGPTSDAGALQPIWGEGVAAIHAAGHILGYHAFNHSAGIWVAPFEPPALTIEAMTIDLDRLEQYADQALWLFNLSRTEVFRPVFRQPYGGAIVSSREGCRVANERGWTCHGFLIDSLDWLVNADVAPDLRERVLSCAQADTVDVVLEQLRRGAAANGCEPVVDVLLHVNQQTADHLGEWIDTLTIAFAEQGRDAVFEAPSVYLNTDMPWLDPSLLSYLSCRR